MEAFKKKFYVYQNKLLFLLRKTHKNPRGNEEIDQTLGGGGFMEGLVKHKTITCYFSLTQPILILFYKILHIN